MRIVRIILLLIAGGAAISMAQGPLTPTAGPSETMRSLDQIEPRTPIDSLPHTIDESGSYFIANNLSVSGTAILVTADNVSLDLQGFTIEGDGTGTGIQIESADGVTVRNGTIRNFDRGLLAENSSYGRFLDLVVADNVNEGLHLRALSGASNGHFVERLRASDNGGRGVVLEADSGGIASGNQLIGIHSINSGEQGIQISAGGSGSEANGNIIRDGRIQGTVSQAALDLRSQFGTSRCNGNIIDNMQIVDNQHKGIALIGAGSDATLAGNIIKNSVIQGNGDDEPGISFEAIFGSHINGNLIENNVVRENASHGIHLFGTLNGVVRGSMIRGNRIENNGGEGIWLVAEQALGTRIQDNVIAGHPGPMAGIRAEVGSSTFILSNIFYENLAIMGGGFVIGPTLAETGEIDPEAGIQGWGNPWSNYLQDPDFL